MNEREALREVLVRMKEYFRQSLILQRELDTASRACAQISLENEAFEFMHQNWQSYFPTDFTRAITKSYGETAEEMFIRLMKE